MDHDDFDKTYFGPLRKGFNLMERGFAYRNALALAKGRPAVKALRKDTGRAGFGLASMRRHALYISRNGVWPIEDQDGAVLLGRDAVNELARRAAKAGMPEKTERQVARHWVFSYPPCDPADLYAAFKNTAARCFGGNYFFALHEDCPIPHIHAWQALLRKDGSPAKGSDLGPFALAVAFADELRRFGWDGSAYTPLHVGESGFDNPLVKVCAAAGPRIGSRGPYLNRLADALLNQRRPEMKNQAYLERCRDDAARFFARMAQACAEDGKDEESELIAAFARFVAKRPMESRLQKDYDYVMARLSEPAKAALRRHAQTQGGAAAFSPNAGQARNGAGAEWRGGANRSDATDATDAADAEEAAGRMDGANATGPAARSRIAAIPRQRPHPHPEEGPGNARAEDCDEDNDGRNVRSPRGRPPLPLRPQGRPKHRIAAANRVGDAALVGDDGGADSVNAANERQNGAGKPNDDEKKGGTKSERAEPMRRLIPNAQWEANKRERSAKKTALGEAAPKRARPGARSNPCASPRFHRAGIKPIDALNACGIDLSDAIVFRPSGKHKPGSLAELAESMRIDEAVATALDPDRARTRFKAAMRILVRQQPAARFPDTETQRRAFDPQRLKPQRRPVLIGEARLGGAQRESSTGSQATKATAGAKAAAVAPHHPARQRALSPALRPDLKPNPAARADGMRVEDGNGGCAGAARADRSESQEESAQGGDSRFDARSPRGGAAPSQKALLPSDGAPTAAATPTATPPPKRERIASARRWAQAELESWANAMAEWACLHPWSQPKHLGLAQSAGRSPLKIMPFDRAAAGRLDSIFRGREQAAALADQAARREALARRLARDSPDGSHDRDLSSSTLPMLALEERQWRGQSEAPQESLGVFADSRPDSAADLERRPSAPCAPCAAIPDAGARAPSEHPNRTRPGVARARTRANVAHSVSLPFSDAASPKRADCGQPAAVRGAESSGAAPTRPNGARASSTGAPASTTLKEDEGVLDPRSARAACNKKADRRKAKATHTPSPTPSPTSRAASRAILGPNGRRAETMNGASALSGRAGAAHRAPRAPQAQGCAAAPLAGSPETPCRDGQSSLAARSQPTIIRSDGRDLSGSSPKPAPQRPDAQVVSGWKQTARSGAGFARPARPSRAGASTRRQPALGCMGPRNDACAKRPASPSPSFPEPAPGAPPPQNAPSSRPGFGMRRPPSGAQGQSQAAPTDTRSRAPQPVWIAKLNRLEPPSAARAAQSIPTRAPCESPAHGANGRPIQSRRADANRSAKIAPRLNVALDPRSPWVADLPPNRGSGLERGRIGAPPGLPRQTVFTPQANPKRLRARPSDAPELQPKRGLDRRDARQTASLAATAIWAATIETAAHAAFGEEGKSHPQPSKDARALGDDKAPPSSDRNATPAQENGNAPQWLEARTGAQTQRDPAANELVSSLGAERIPAPSDANETTTRAASEEPGETLRECEAEWGDDGQER